MINPNGLYGHVGLPVPLKKKKKKEEETLFVNGMVTVGAV